MIDYAAQFKLVSDETAAEMTRTWKNHRTYLNAKQAFTSAQRTENRGIDVAFAKTGDCEYHVWTVMLEDVDGCSDCGYLWPLSDLTDLTREGYDPCKVFICPDCNVKVPACWRCGEELHTDENGHLTSADGFYICTDYHGHDEHGTYGPNHTLADDGDSTVMLDTDCPCTTDPLELVYARCLVCGYETHDEHELDMWNGYGDHIGTWTPACTNHSVWVRRDGSVVIVHGEGQFTEIDAPTPI
jgi:hypothetical protein